MKTLQRKAVSPVIATVILVAVAITVSIGVSYWMSGISGQYTQFEKVEIQTAYAARDDTAPTGWIITLSVKNSGSADATITHVFINDVIVNDLAATGVVLLQTGADIDIGTTGLALTAGNDADVLVFISDTYKTLSAGTTVNVKLHSASGMDYIKLVKLP